MLKTCIGYSSLTTTRFSVWPNLPSSSTATILPIQSFSGKGMASKSTGVSKDTTIQQVEPGWCSVGWPFHKSLVEERVASADNPTLLMTWKSGYGQHTWDSQSHTRTRCTRRGQRTTQKLFWLIKTPSLSTSTGTLTPSRCTRSGSHKLTKI